RQPDSDGQHEGIPPQLPPPPPDGTGERSPDITERLGVVSQPRAYVMRDAPAGDRPASSIAESHPIRPAQAVIHCARHPPSPEPVLRVNEERIRFRSETAPIENDGGTGRNPRYAHQEFLLVVRYHDRLHSAAPGVAEDRAIPVAFERDDRLTLSSSVCVWLQRETCTQTRRRRSSRSRPALLTHRADREA